MTEAAGASTPDGGQAPADGAPPAGTPPPAAGQAPAATPTPTPPPVDDDPDAGLDEAGLRAALKKVRGEAAGNRTKLREHEERAEAERLAKLTDIERAQAERDAALASSTAKDKTIRDLRARTVILESATRAGFRNPELAYRLVDVDSLEFDNDGRPKGVDAALRKLLEADPYLGKAPAGGDFGGGPRGGGNGDGQDMNAFIRRAAGRQT